MGLRILAALDDSDNAKRAAEFMAKAFSKEHKITLLSILPDTAAICQLNSPSLTPYFKSQQADFCALEEKKKESVTETLNTVKRILGDAGFNERDIEIKIRTQEQGIARDIIKEASSGYDAVVIGRRGLSGVKEFMLGSISQKVLHGLKNISVVIVE